MQDSKIKVIKNNHLGQEVWRYGGEIVKLSPYVLLVEAFFNRPDLPFHEIILKEGDRFIERYPFGKWFNIYQIHDRDDGTLKAWYCNITRPVRMSDQQIEYDDLALDLLIYPDRRQLVLDEDEFYDLNLDEAEQYQAINGLQELKKLFADTNEFDIWKDI
jgi:hypothetical protein